jgi:hypothetical protein
LALSGRVRVGMFVNTAYSCLGMDDRFTGTLIVPVS